MAQRRVTITTRGALALALTPVSAIAGLLAGAEELVLLALGLACLLAGGLVQSASRARSARGGWRITSRLDSSDVAAGSELDGHLSVTATGAAASVPTWLEDPVRCWSRVLGPADPAPARRPRANPSLALRVAPPGSGAAPEIPLGAPTGQRGIFTLRGVRHWCFDTFGLFAQLIGTGPSATITVYPVPSSVPVDAALLRGEPGSEDSEHVVPDAPKRRDSLGDFAGIRPYVPGDRLRLLYWPALARTGDLMVRDFEDSGPRRVHLVADTRPILGEQGAERALAAAAGVGRQILALGAVVEFSTLTGGRTAIGPGPFGDAALLRAIAAVPPAAVAPAGRLWWRRRAASAPVPAAPGLAPMTGAPLLVTTEEGARSLPGALRAAHLVLAP
jgi:uncharacterized protein (DUF58 family)